MQTQANEYQEYLNSKYKPGRSLYLRCLMYPAYLRRLGYVGGEICDLGCGNGEFLKFCVSRGIPAHGVDWNDAFVKQCQGAGLKVCKANVVEYAPETPVPYALCDNVLEHLTSDEITGFLVNSRRVVCQGGRLLIVVPGEKAYPRDPTHVTFLDEGVMRSLCQRSESQLVGASSLPFSSRLLGRWFYLNMNVFVVRI